MAFVASTGTTDASERSDSPPIEGVELCSGGAPSHGRDVVIVPLEALVTRIPPDAVDPAVLASRDLRRMVQITPLVDVASTDGPIPFKLAAIQQVCPHLFRPRYRVPAHATVSIPEHHVFLGLPPRLAESQSDSARAPELISPCSSPVSMNFSQPSDNGPRVPGVRPLTGPENSQPPGKDPAYKADEAPTVKVYPSANEMPSLRSERPAHAPMRPPTTPGVALSSEGSDEVSAKEDHTISLNLRGILEGLPIAKLGFDAKKIPANVTTELPVSLIQSQLASGQATVALGDVIAGCLEKYRPAFAKADREEAVQLPINEIEQQLPQKPAMPPQESPFQPAQPAADNPFQTAAAAQEPKVDSPFAAAAPESKGPAAQQPPQEASPFQSPFAAQAAGAPAAESPFAQAGPPKEAAEAASPFAQAAESAPAASPFAQAPPASSEAPVSPFAAEAQPAPGANPFAAPAAATPEAEASPFAAQAPKENPFAAPAAAASESSPFAAAPASPAASPFAQQQPPAPPAEAAPPASEAPASPFGAASAAEQEGADASPFAAPSSDTSPFAAPAENGTNPFAASAAAATPAAAPQGNGSSPFAAPAQENGASPFGAPSPAQENGAAPAAESPFGAAAPAAAEAPASPFEAPEQAASPSKAEVPAESPFGAPAAAEAPANPFEASAPAAAEAPTPFGAPAAEAAAPQTPVEPAAIPAAAPAQAAPAPAQPAAPAQAAPGFEFGFESDPKQLILRALFGVEQPLSLEDVLDRLASFDGLQVCVLIDKQSGAAKASRGADEGKTKAFEAQAQQAYNKVISLAEDLQVTNAESFTLRTGQGAMSFFNAPKACLAVLQDAVQFQPGVRERLTLVTRELSEMLG